MFEGIINFFKKMGKAEKEQNKSKEAAKERLHLVLMQDRANVSADFLDLMKQEIIEVIKKYIDVDENAIDVRLTNKSNGDGTTGAPALYANIPIVSIKEKVKNGMARQKEESKEEIKPPIQTIEEPTLEHKTEETQKTKPDETKNIEENLTNGKEEKEEVVEIAKKEEESNKPKEENKPEEKKQEETHN